MNKYRQEAGAVNRYKKTDATIKLHRIQFYSVTNLVYAEPIEQ